MRKLTLAGFTRQVQDGQVAEHGESDFHQAGQHKQQQRHDDRQFNEALPRGFSFTEELTKDSHI
jgi:hypothetical protein